MIEGYIGIPGAGKSWSMTVRAYKDRRLYDEIVTNYGLNEERFGDHGTKLVRMRNAQDFVDITMRALYQPDGKRRLILLDEVHSILDARNWTKVPQEALMVLAQPRKARLDLLYTAQHESQVEKRLRVVTNWMWLCQSWGTAFNMFRDSPVFMYARCYENFSFERARTNPGRVECYGTRLSRISKKYTDLYDTMEVLERMDFQGVGTSTSRSVES
jgi:hypothetical protein